MEGPAVYFMKLHLPSVDYQPSYNTSFFSAGLFFLLVFSITHLMGGTRRSMEVM